MGDRSKIEWTEASWTPIRARTRATGDVGWHCEIITPGCEHCYAQRINLRLGTGGESGYDDQQGQQDSFHGLMTLTRRVISSTGISSPCPDPGQTVLVRSQASGLSTLLSQNGHVRHCGGRTG